MREILKIRACRQRFRMSVDRRSHILLLNYFGSLLIILGGLNIYWVVEVFLGDLDLPRQRFKRDALRSGVCDKEHRG